MSWVFSFDKLFKIKIFLGVPVFVQLETFSLCNGLLSFHFTTHDLIIYGSSFWLFETIPSNIHM